ncbi:GDP-mannose 4,6-dehydratase [Clostridium paraputrificum]|uniref:GDP-mannose 4,6-dehydratase n=1 Tax=Clostridium paraputrificum TaxID=29363 RepID=UPI003D34A5FD
MKKVLIIGANGFVGTHLARELKNNSYICLGADLNDISDNNEFDSVYKLNILDEESINIVLEKTRPDYIINLAAISSVKKSWDIPSVTFDVNVKGTINILECIRKAGLKARVLLIGSSEQYGKIDYSKAVSEDSELNSINPYGISKYTQEKVALMYKEAYGIEVILVRAFNHIGPGQGKGFVIPDFVSQVVGIKNKGIKSNITVGNLSAKRDFTDVRDIVCAYRLLLEKGVSGEIYNVGSGIEVEIKQVLNLIIKLVGLDIEVIVDENKYRRIETPSIVCDNSKLKNATGWGIKYKLEESLIDIIEYWNAYENMEEPR